MNTVPNSESAAKEKPPALLQFSQRTSRDFFKIWGPSLVIMILGFLLTWFFIEPAPEHQLKIAAGPRTGNYYQTAQWYAKEFRKEGVDLEVVETAGSVENYQLLQEENGIDLAIVQGGTAPEDLNKEAFEALGSLYFEPLWIFLPAEEMVDRLIDLKDKRISLGQAGSGTEALMIRLLRMNGLIEARSENTAEKSEPVPVGKTRLFRESNPAGIEKLLAGERDAVCLVMSPENSTVKKMMAHPEIAVMPFSLNRTYRLLLPALSDLTCQQGVLDLKENLPDRDLPLIAPAANLVCVPEMHDAFIPLLMKAATLEHAKGSLLVPPGQFPSLEYIEFEPHPSATEYLKSGRSFLHHYLPFWIASFLNRTKIMLIPLITLAFPLFKIAPPIYRWRIRSRIYRWYFILREIDQQQLTDKSRARQQEHLAKLRQMARELSEIDVPLSYMEEFYNLHLHIDLIRRRVLDNDKLN